MSLDHFCDAPIHSSLIVVGRLLSPSAGLYQVAAKPWDLRIDKLGPARDVVVSQGLFSVGLILFAI